MNNEIKNEGEELENNSNSAVVEKVSVVDIESEKQKEQKEKDDDLVRRIMSKILEIK